MSKNCDSEDSYFTVDLTRDEAKVIICRRLQGSLEKEDWDKNYCGLTLGECIEILAEEMLVFLSSRDDDKKIPWEDLMNAAYPRAVAKVALLGEMIRKQSTGGQHEN